jgi:hypothetical protein
MVPTVMLVKLVTKDQEVTLARRETGVAKVKQVPMVLLLRFAVLLV